MDLTVAVGEALLQEILDDPLLGIAHTSGTSNIRLYLHDLSASTKIYPIKFYTQNTCLSAYCKNLSQDLQTLISSFSKVGSLSKIENSIYISLECSQPPAI